MRELIKNIGLLFSIKGLRNRITNSFVCLLAFRIGSFVVLPGVDASKLRGYREGILGILDTFLGGAFSNASILGLGIMPYISASIIVQLLTVLLPSFQRMQLDGAAGRKKLGKITKFLTLVVCLIQSTGYLAGTISSEVLLVDRMFFTISSLMFLTSGTMFCMWLGDRISDKGVGNGTSLLISVGILSSLPGAIFSEYVHRGGVRGLMILMLELIVLYFIVMLVVAFTHATRKIPIQYSRQLSSNAGYVGQRQYIPFKLNMTGVMPIIFSQTIMLVPYFVFKSLSQKNDFAASATRYFLDTTCWQYNLMFGCLVVLFTFFYTAITINTDSMASDMKKNNSFIPGVLSGKFTSAYLEDILNKLTFPGAVFLALISALPLFASLLGMSGAFGRFYGGTSLLILVGVVCDLISQVESYMLMSKYDSFSVKRQ